ncbi:hypothetical protein BKA62DRAFT_819926 [Auriculariales sp. MPI-PUGE-AT-0066]|nr:hypothetical protein BKA62DRAFT_819926 [Auriculariales sp. MPI-PUGE-AT-0066]
MADYESRGQASYSNLLAQTYTAIGLTGFCLLVNEGMRRIPRTRARGPSSRLDQATLDAVERARESNLINDEEAEALKQLKSRENWVTAYLYLGRCFAAIPSPPHPRIPLAWILQVLRTPEDKYLLLAGVDAAVYLRFLRGCLYFVGLHTCTTLVIILPIHYVYGGKLYLRGNINRGGIGSVSYPSAPPKVAKLLWVHMIMLFWITSTWIFMLAWFLRGVLRMRAIAARNAPVRAMPSNARSAPSQPPGDRKAMCANEKRPETAADIANSDPAVDGLTKDYSLRSRTILMTNIPQYMRTETEIREYFKDFLARVAETTAQKPWHIVSRSKSTNKTNLELQSHQNEAGDPSGDLIESVTIVRKLSTVAELCEKYERDLEDLERAHIKLAQNVMQAVRIRVGHINRERGFATMQAEGRVPWWLNTSIGQWFAGLDDSPDHSSEYFEHIDTLVDLFRPFMETAARRDNYYSIRQNIKRWLRTRLSASPTVLPATSSESTADLNFETPDNIWDVLLSLPREVLAPYQPQTRTTHSSAIFLPFNLLIDAVLHFFRPEASRWIDSLPTIDLAFSRLQMHSAKLEELRAVEENDLPPASSAFITFRSWQGARRAARTLPYHPWRPLTCLTQLAPQYEDVDWRRIVKGKFTAQFLRDWIIGLFIWLMIIAWVIPIQAAVTLFSSQSLRTILPGLDAFFLRHSKIEAFVTGLLPTFIVVLLGLLVPVILFAIGRKLQTEVTWSSLHDGILQRYYKWAVLNLVLFFCIGAAAFSTFLQRFRTEPSPFNLIATSFPAAAPFYAGFFILQTSTQSALQLGLIGLPILQYIFGASHSRTPRARFRGTRPRTIDYHYWLPNHLVALHIIFIFSILNPLVIPLALIYFAVAFVVFKNQFLHVYARRLYEGNGKMLAIRILRYSCDGLGLSQIVFLAYNLVRDNPDGNSEESDKARAGLCGVLLGLTMIGKIVGTKVFRSRFARVEDAEFARIAGQDELFPTSPLTTVPGRGSADLEGSPTTASPTSATQATFHRRHSTDEIMHFRTPTYAKAPVSLIPWQATFSAGNPMEALRRTNRHRRAKSHVPEGITEGSNESFHDVGPAEALETADDASTIHQPSAPGLNPRLLIQAPAKIVRRLLPGHKSQPSIPTRDFIDCTEPDCAVVAHPPVIPWDDSPDSSIPYRSPYHDPLPTALWLPRDPFAGVMDLDDTVEMRRVLISALQEDQPDGAASLSVDGIEIPISSSPPPISVNSSLYNPGSEEGHETAFLSQSPAPLSGVPSQVDIAQDRSPLNTPSRLSLPRRLSSVGEKPRLPARRPSIAEALHVAAPQGRRVASAQSLLSPPVHGQTMGQGTLLAAVRGSRQGHGDAVSVAGASAFSQRSSGHNSALARARTRRTSLQTRNAIQARVREESEREESSRRMNEQTEALEDHNAERGATVRWAALRNMIKFSPKE